MVLVVMAALPWGASAQDVEEGASSEATVEEPVPEEPTPSTEATPEEPSLQLKLGDAGVEVLPSPPRTVHGYTLEEMDLRVRQARIGLISTAAAFVVGFPLAAAGAVAYECSTFCLFEEECPAGHSAGRPQGEASQVTGSALGDTASGDLARSRLVF